MWALKAFVLGALAVGVVAYALVAALAVISQAGGRTLDISLGPLTFVAVTRSGAATVTTFGAGLFLLALAGGLLNLVAAEAIRNRSGGRGDRVD
jgi:predicted Co/Zn/Cd cation transporter (cation efflux family)